jgi:pimeloyl-ACP methyl ester carboxylesterase
MADSELVTLPDGRRMQFWRGGVSSGPAVLFLPGTPDSRLVARSGADVADRAGVDLVAINRPGYGLSDPAESDHLSVADDVVAVADALGIERFALLGMSLGGPYALACAVKHPERVRAVGVVAAPAIAPELDPPWHRDDLAPEQREFFSRIASSTVSAAVDRMRPDFEAYIADLAPDDTDDESLADRLARQLHPLDAELTVALPAADVAASTREALMQTDGYLRDAAVTFRVWDFRPESVRCPTWLWYGEFDANAPVRNGRWFEEHIPGARLVVRRQTAHLGTLIAYWDDILTTLRDGDEPSR